MFHVKHHDLSAAAAFFGTLLPTSHDRIGKERQMNDTEEAVVIAGHIVTAVGHDKGVPTGDQTLFRCDDCRTTTTRHSFLAGTTGCPGRPQSLDYLSVCPGGDLCPGHPDTDSSEWRAYTRSSNISLTTVPRLHCPVSELGVRAARQYLCFADKIGMKMSAWAQGQAASVGVEGGIVAEFTLAGKSYAVHVNPLGKISAHRFTA